MQTGEKQPKRCGAKNRPGAKHPFCQDRPAVGRTRCRRHGGLTPKGPDSPHWKTGEWVKGEKPKALGEQYQESLGDPQLMAYRHDAALYEALRRHLTIRLKGDRAVPASIEKRLIDLGEAIRKIKESENRRLRDLQLVVAVDRHIAVLRMLGEIHNVTIAQECERARAALIAKGLKPEDAAAIVNPLNFQLAVKKAVAQAAFRQPALVIDVPAKKDEEGEDGQTA
jgi:hypothetical protein